MKKLISMILSVLMILSMSATAYAAPTAADISQSVNIVTDNATLTAVQTVTLGGVEIEEAKDKLVNLRIWQSGKTAADYTPGVNELEVFAVLLQTSADENGTFEFEFPFSEPAATYMADIKIEGQPIIANIAISTANVTAINDFLAKINNATQLASMTTADFAPVIADPSYYGVDLTSFNDLSPANQNAVLTAAINLFKANNAASIKNTTDVVSSALAENTLIKIFEQTNDATILNRAFTTYSALVDITAQTSIKALYDGFDAAGKNSVLIAMGNKTYADVASIVNTFKETIFLKAIKDTTYSTDIATVIDNSLDYIAFATENELTAKNSYIGNSAVKTFICDQINIIKASLGNLAAFKTAFVNAAYAYVPPTQGGGSSGGGYGGGGASSNVSIGSSLLPSETPISIISAFNDMSGHWASPAVSYLAGLRIVSGRGDNKFYPSNQVTRAEYVKMVVEAYGLYDSHATADFIDVTPDQWYYQYIASMVKKGYVLGNEEGTFNPNALISRQDMAVILYRVLQGQNLVKVINTLEVMFDDFEDVSPYAQNCVSYMSNMKLINGADGKYRPHDSSTRAEAAQIIYNALMEVGN
ncbi:MAG: S-layer homology domain-containing protein [Clostridia bacterium]|nr:S-layer homology domain-containing protein [Clostridia bacterium]